MPGMPKLETIRKSKGMSRETLARHVDVSSSTIYHLERGLITEPSYHMVLRLAEVLECVPNDFFVLEDISKPISSAA
jgi:DNA-binding XRE family transcriptional regulator